ncbi:MAG: hypothetical protein E7301_11210 [Butyrivibrio sp.]|nr:hypothetical protein [Butyrivibrio sp.]
MQEDFHYYATYCAAYLAGFTHEESMEICYSAQFVDCCTVSILSRLKAPHQAATTQLNMEMMDARTDIYGLQEITRIWASFHFLPYDLYATKEHCSKRYLNKYRLICGPNGQLVRYMINAAKGGTTQKVGVAMHVLADTWAHRYFAGTPSLVINNTNYHFYEYVMIDGKETMRQVAFKHNPTAKDDLDKGIYINTMYQGSESAIMNLGHGRAGHFPDYSFAKYKYLPAWGEYKEIVKDNREDFYNAFCQMVYAMKFIRGERDEFELSCYEYEELSRYEEEIKGILSKRQLLASDDWKQFGEKLSGREIEDFQLEKYFDEYLGASVDEKGDTYMGKFINAALAQKAMVAGKIYNSGNPLVGIAFRGRR